MMKLKTNKSSIRIKLKKIIYDKLGLMDEIENKLDFYIMAKKKNLEIKKIRTEDEIVEKRGPTCNFFGRREKKTLIGDKPLHLCQHASYHKKEDMIEHLLTLLNSNFRR